jgi:surface carbohydrate biosynthesis protein (TIGR04326 family)
VLTVWDSNADPSGRSGLVYTWNGYEESDSVRSLLGYVDVHADRLRHRYLAWMHELGEQQFDGKRIIDHLVLEEGLSYWWMTLFVEQSPWKSASIGDALRLLALEEVILAHKPRTLRLVSNNRLISEILGALCRDLGVSFEPTHLPGKPFWRRSAAELYRALPQQLQALVSFARHIQARWPLRRADKSGWFGGDRSLFLCSYFIHLDKESCMKGNYHSHHWEGLPKILVDAGYCTNWMQHYLQSNVVPNTAVANEWVRRFNRQNPRRSFHSFLDAYLSWRIVYRAFRNWIRLGIASRRLRGIELAFQPPGSSLLLWPLMRRDWQASFRGSVAIGNLLWVALFEEAMGSIPRQKMGLYLCENQAWERALIHAWRKHGHGRLIAVAHSTVRFWDLRYFTDSRTVRSLGPHPLPLPDNVVLNGEAAVEAYRCVDYPQEAIIECEALRYGHLGALRRDPASRAANRDCMRVLILGDYSRASTSKMLRLLEGAVARMAVRGTYVAKAHPNFLINAKDYPSLHLTVITDSLSEILHDFDIAYASNGTSAAVDAYLTGLPVVVMLDTVELNFSPLRNRPGVRFVATEKDLAEALLQGARQTFQDDAREALFFLDPELPRWKKLLGINCTSAD